MFNLTCGIIVLIFLKYISYSNGDQIKEDEREDTCNTDRKMRNSDKNFVGKP